MSAGKQTELVLVATEEDLIEIQELAKKGDRLAQVLLRGSLDEEQQ